MPPYTLPRRPGISATFGLGVALAGLLLPARPGFSCDPRAGTPAPRRPARTVLHPGTVFRQTTAGLVKGQTYAVEVSLRSGSLGDRDRVAVRFRGPDGRTIHKDLHAGDPDLYVHYRGTAGGPAVLELAPSAGSSQPIPVETSVQSLGLTGADQAAFEAEPNDSWRTANPLILGRTVYGTADDVDYLDNQREGQSGLDWFRIEYTDPQPCLAYIQLDILDRDVSVNLRMYTVDPKTAALVPYLDGKDPMEIVHDRERERYSKAISRVLRRGTYFLEVNANHPDYILRTRKLPVPPYTDPHQAVEAGMQYIMNVGDAWFAQVPRAGNIYRRVQNLHDTAIRCTACHPSVFSTESNLVARQNGYPIRSKSNFLYVVNRLYNSITPLYEDQGAGGGSSHRPSLYWQRFISIPLQAQGKQGGIVMDFERTISGRPSRTFERFAPFLRAAWADRTDLPPDEQNGVVPLDSRYGFAWRDWRVLHEAAQRTGDRGFAAAARRIARVLLDPKTQAESTGGLPVTNRGLQDAIHMLQALLLIEPARHPVAIARQADVLFKLQNPDGGWPDYVAPGRGSAEYTTGQVLTAMIQAGHRPANDPRIARALRWLMGRQQSFGGWFQTTTHENFRTPMRETRYAVEALAMAYPIAGAPTSGWANRDDGPARLPRTDTLLHTLDDLDNLWDVPAAERPRFGATIVPLLRSPQPLVRLHAAACLGRIGTPEAVRPLIGLLNDPSKMVWRTAAWSLRQMGNFGVGVDAIQAALRSPDPLVRRGAARVFAYQFFGMDERLDIARDLIKLTADPDLWTRLQALKTLRQWWYRTNDRSLQRQIIDTYIARMGVPEPPSIRKNLIEGMYIMLDENLGGGVSLQNATAELPAAVRPRILEARKTVERDVLLEPILAALAGGNPLQREALVRSFDGSFFKGRTYARNPRDQIDVGNDREFGFLYEPPAPLLDRTFAALLRVERRPGVRAMALALASFFHVPSQGPGPDLQLTLLKEAENSDPAVRRAAQAIVGHELSLTGAQADPRLVHLVRQMLFDPVTRRAVIEALGRNPALLGVPDLRAAVRQYLKAEDGPRLLLPVLRLPVFTDQEVIDMLDLAWVGADSADDRMALLHLLVARPTLVDVPDPPQAVTTILRRAIKDPSVAVREQTFRLASSLKKLWTSPVGTGMLLNGLTDDSPSIRLLCLQLGDSNPPLWKRGDTHEQVLRLLIDPDRKIRQQALAAVQAHHLIELEPRLIRRIKGVMADGDAGLRKQAEALLRSHGIDPAKVEADLVVQRPRMLNIAYFRKSVNPIFYTVGPDGHSCSECHANHTILRIAERVPGQPLTTDQVMLNYNSVLKVVNLGDPEQSLILRKPRSPFGQAGTDPRSPTGLTHVGGPRWSSTENPAYQAILTWIRSATAAAPHAAPRYTVSADSYAPAYPPQNAVDGDPGTIWHTEFVGATPGYPHELVINLNTQRLISGLAYTPRQDLPNGRVKDYEVYVSVDGRHWTGPVARGAWPDDATTKRIAIPEVQVHFIKLVGLSEVNGKPYMSAAEIEIDFADMAPVPKGKGELTAKGATGHAVRKIQD